MSQFRSREIGSGGKRQSPTVCQHHLQIFIESHVPWRTSCFHYISREILISCEQLVNLLTAVSPAAPAV